MAKEAKAAAESAEQAPAPKRGKKLLIVALAAVLVLVLAGGGAFFLLKKGDDQADDEDATETTHAKKAKKGKEGHPIFATLEPFTVNLVPETGDQYLQVSLVVEFDDPAAEQELKVQMPKVRNNITLLLSGKKPSELLTKEGKEKLATELMETINELLEPGKKGKKAQPADGPAKAVLFTSFIIQ